MKCRILFYSLVSFLLAACQKDVAGVKSVTLQGERLKVDTAVMGINWHLYSDSVVLMQDYHSNPVYDVCVLRKDSLVRIGDFGTRGTGPYDFEAFPECVAESDSKSLYVSCGNFLKVMEIPSPVGRNIFRPQTWKRHVVPPVAKNFYGFGCCVVNDSSILSVGGSYEKDHVFSLLPDNGLAVPVQGFAYPDGEESCPPVIKRNIYNESWLAKRPFHNEYVWAGELGRYVCLFKLEGNTAKNVRYIEKDFPKYAVGNDGINPKRSEDNFPGYAVDVTQNYIYLQPSAFNAMRDLRSNTAYKGYPNYFRDRMDVYDWEGNLVARYVLDIPVSNLVVSSDDRYIYGHSVDLETGEEIYLRFKLDYK